MAKMKTKKKEFVDNGKGPEFNLTLDRCEVLFGLKPPIGRSIPFRIEKILRLYFAGVSDEYAAEVLQRRPEDIQGLYGRYLKLALQKIEDLQ